MSAFITANPLAIGSTYKDIALVKDQSEYQESFEVLGRYIGFALSSLSQAISTNWNSQYQAFSASGTHFYGPNTPGPYDDASPGAGFIKNSTAAAWSIDYTDGDGYGANVTQQAGPSYTIGRTGSNLGHDSVVITPWYNLAEVAMYPDVLVGGDIPDWFQVEGRVRIEAYAEMYQMFTSTGFTSLADVPHWWAIGKVLVESQMRVTGVGSRDGTAAPASWAAGTAWVPQALPHTTQDPADVVFEELSGLVPRYVTLHLPKAPDEGAGVGGAALSELVLRLEFPDLGDGYFDLTDMTIACLTPWLKRADL